VHLGWLALWVALSEFIIIILALVIRASEGSVAFLYNSVGYAESDGKAGIVTLLILTCGIYIFFTNKATEFVLKDKVREHVLETDAKPQNEDRQFDFYGLVKSIFNSGPFILKPVLEYFYDNTRNVIDSCGHLLVDKYGPQNCLNSFKNHLAMSGSKDMAYLSENMNDFETDMEKACFVMTGEITLFGFSATENAVYNFIQLSKSKGISKGKRVDKNRITLPAPKEIELIGNSFQIGGRVLEFSEDGSGCYIETKANTNLPINDVIKIKAQDKYYSGKIIHDNAKLFASKKKKEKISKGIGIKIVNYEAAPFSALLKQGV